MINELKDTRCKFCGGYGLKDREDIEKWRYGGTYWVYWLCKCGECNSLNRVFWDTNDKN